MTAATGEREAVKVYQALAEGFVDEGTRHVFTLMGDATMHWHGAIEKRGASMISVRHEAAAVAMASGYAHATNDVGVCAVTCGPGLTQIATPLVVATRSKLPLVVLAGDTPMTEPGVPQDIDQRRFIEACGAKFQPLRGPGTAAEDVQLAFAAARMERRPVVLNAPKDIQRQEYPWDWEYVPSLELLPPTQRTRPSPADVGTVGDLLRRSKRPVIIAGRGAVRSECREEVLALASRIGALVSTTLPAKGWLDTDPFCVGISGAFSSRIAEELFTEADLVVAVGASLGSYTTEGRLLYPNASYVVINEAPGLVAGSDASDRYLQGDARESLRSLLDELSQDSYQNAGFRSPVTAARFGATEAARDVSEPGTVDPRALVRLVEQQLAADTYVVTGVGHYWPFPVMHMRAPEAGFLTIYDFLAIGQCLSGAIGVAVGRPDTTVVAFEGDASLMMQLPELDTAARHGIRLLVVVINDEALGAELHALEAEGVADVSGSLCKTPALDEVARSLGCAGRRATSLEEVQNGLDEFAKIEDRPYLLDVRVARSDTSELFRRMRLGQPSTAPHQGLRAVGGC